MAEDPISTSASPSVRDYLFSARYRYFQIITLVNFGIVFFLPAIVRATDHIWSGSRALALLFLFVAYDGSLLSIAVAIPLAIHYRVKFAQAALGWLVALVVAKMAGTAIFTVLVAFGFLLGGLQMH